MEKPKIFFVIGSFLGDWGLIWFLISLYLFFFKKRGLTESLLPIIVGLLLVPPLNSVLKNKFRVERPEEANYVMVPLRKQYSYSFPSGQALASGYSTVVLARSRPELFLFFLFSCFICISRVRLNQHHLKDVVFGYLVGFLLGLAIRKVLSSSLFCN